MPDYSWVRVVKSLYQGLSYGLRFVGQADVPLDGLNCLLYFCGIIPRKWLALVIKVFDNEPTDRSSTRHQLV
jgi:hypothetical protein